MSPKNKSISSPALLALIDTINAASTGERESVWLAMEAIRKETSKFGIHGTVGLAIVNAGLMYAIKHDDFKVTSNADDFGGMAG